MKNKKTIPNLLDFVPVQSLNFKYEVDENAQVTILVQNKGIFNFIAQKLFFKPKVSQIHLEEFGSFIWLNIDGKRTVKEIADILHEKFGEKADPLYPRISMYFGMLKNYGFVEYIK